MYVEDVEDIKTSHNLFDYCRKTVKRKLLA